MRLKLGIAAGAVVSLAGWAIFLIRGGTLGSVHTSVVIAGIYLLLQLAGFGYAGAIAARHTDLSAAIQTGAIAGLTYALLSAIPRTLLRLLDPEFLRRLQHIPPTRVASPLQVPDPFLSIVSTLVSGLLINALLGCVFGLLGPQLLGARSRAVR